MLIKVFDFVQCEWARKSIEPKKPQHINRQNLRALIFSYTRYESFVAFVSALIPAGGGIFILVKYPYPTVTRRYRKETPPPLGVFTCSCVGLCEWLSIFFCHHFCFSSSSSFKISHTKKWLNQNILALISCVCIRTATNEDPFVSLCLCVHMLTSV